MNETIIEFDNKKRLKLALFGFLMTIAALAFAYYIFFVAEKIRIFPGALMLTLGGLGCYCLIGIIKALFNKDRTGLLLNADGIRYNGTPVGIKVGTVKWTAIQSVSTGMAHGVHFVFLKLAAQSRKLYPAVRSTSTTTCARKWNSHFGRSVVA